ncbi:hypothetical protein HPP92_013751 [Vanilla planifolia]|uniref:Uncharacterized protein n=1 Tax=Vanilla planifolia TaxID=51239 RepID=A0A835PGR8_VANPL|nr:hypothetical protein HPP92_026473 [Vanilla planifolia]KAG0479032.1 hypothetical protein HPP92_013751 [Vanilla planifolia]
MDPSSVISQSALPEMWRFPMAGMAPAVRSSAAGMGIRDASAGESTVTEQSGGNWSRKRRRGSGPSSAAASEDETSKLVSTSCGGMDLTDGEAKHREVGNPELRAARRKQMLRQALLATNKIKLPSHQSRITSM